MEFGAEITQNREYNLQHKWHRILRRNSIKSEAEIAAEIAAEII